MQYLVTSNLAPDLYVRALSNAYKTGHRIYDPDYAHSQDPEAYDKMLRDPEIAHAAQYRRQLVAGRDWHIQPYDDQPASVLIAKIVEQGLLELQRFSMMRYNLADAIFRGMAVSKIEGARIARDFGDGVLRPWWMPTQARDMDKWRFRQVPVPNTPSQTEWQYWDVAATSWVSLTRQQRRTLVVHKYLDTEQTLGYGKGLLEALYHFYWAKTITLREGLQGIERWAQGWIVAEVDSLRRGSSGKDNAAHTQEWLDSLDAQRSRHSFVHGKEDKITLHETSGQGHEMVMSMMHYLDQAMSRLILAGLLPTGGGSQFGSLARAKEESESTESLTQFDKDLLSETISYDLISMFMARNRSNIVALGLGNAHPPKFVLASPKKNKIVEEIDVISKALTVKIPLRKDEVYARIGYSVPTPSDEIIDPNLEAMGERRNPLTGRFEQNAHGDENAPPGNNKQDTGSGSGPPSDSTPPPKVDTGTV